jgi:hypothetical protein
MKPAIIQKPQEISNTVSTKKRREAFQKFIDQLVEIEYEN